MLKIAEGIEIETLTAPIFGHLHHAHCSGIVAFPDGELFAVFYWALKEANRNQAIYGCRKRPEDSHWSRPFLIKTDKHRMVGNPSIWIAPDTGRLWLFFVKSWGGWAVCNPRVCYSDDQGKTWSQSQSLYKFISRGIKNPAILTKRGWYVLPAYIEFRDYFTLFYISKDQGKTWTEHGRVKIPDNEVPSEMNFKWGRLVLQPTVIEREDESLIALMRAKRTLGKMYYTESFDGGESWTTAKPYILPNPGGGFHWMRLQSGRIAIIYNHAPVLPEHEFERNPLSIALTEDEGKTWKYRRNLFEAHGDQVHQRIGGYPSMTQGHDGTLHIIWSFAHPMKTNGNLVDITDIQYTSCTEEWIMEHPFFDTAWDDSPMHKIEFPSY